MRRMVLLLLLVPQFCFAAGDQQWHIGWLLGAVNSKVNDPSGSTNTNTTTLWKDIVVQYDLSRDNRLFAIVDGYSYKLAATPDLIGQSVSHTGGTLSLQHQLRVSRTFKPWFGIGAGFANESFAPRYTVTSTGFLLNHYSDRTASGPLAVANATAQWRFVSDTELGVHLQYEHGFNGLSNTFLFSLMLSY